MTQNDNIYRQLTQTATFFTTIQQQTYRRKQLMDQADDNSLTALLTKKDQVRFREIVNTCTERRAEKRIQRTAWILSHVLRKTLCEHVNGLRPAGWLNEQSITKHWFQSVRTCPYSWATGHNNNLSILKRGPAGSRWIVCGQVCGKWWPSTELAAGTLGRVAPGDGARQTLSEPAGNVYVFPLRPVRGCEGLIQLKKALSDSAWPIAANAAIRAYLHPNDVGLSWARHTWQLRWRKLHASCTADPPDACGWTLWRLVSPAVSIFQGIYNIIYFSLNI